MQRPHLLDGFRWSPWVPAVVGKRNPTTLRMEWQVDPSRKVGVRLFARGYPYRAFGLIPTTLHLLGTGETSGVWLRERIMKMAMSRRVTIRSGQ